MQWHSLVPAFFVLFLVAFSLPAAEGDEDFEKHTFVGADGGRLPYRLLRPKDEAPRHPLLVFLHGAGERGTDNRAQLIHGKPMMRAAARDHGCLVFAPQCPPEQAWAGRHWTDPVHALAPEPSAPMRLMFEAVAQLQKTERVDADRIYIMGLSMGGYGTWEAIQRRPEFFAAAVPICGGGDEGRVETIARLPIWVFHGERDMAVPVARSRDMVAALKKAGGLPRYTEYPGVGHNAWDNAFREPDLLKWLTGQQRKE